METKELLDNINNIEYEFAIMALSSIDDKEDMYEDFFNQLCKAVSNLCIQNADEELETLSCKVKNKLKEDLSKKEHDKLFLIRSAFFTITYYVSQLYEEY